MTAHRSYTVYCDGPDCDAPTPNPDLSHTTMMAARREAEYNGYVNRGSLDFCPDCQVDGTMEAVLHRRRLARAAR